VGRKGNRRFSKRLAFIVGGKKSGTQRASSEFRKFLSFWEGRGGGGSQPVWVISASGEKKTETRQKRGESYLMGGTRRKELGKEKRNSSAKEVELRRQTSKLPPLVERASRKPARSSKKKRALKHEPSWNRKKKVA